MQKSTLNLDSRTFKRKKPLFLQLSHTQKLISIIFSLYIAIFLTLAEGKEKKDRLSLTPIDLAVTDDRELNNRSLDEDFAYVVQFPRGIPTRICTVGRLRHRVQVEVVEIK